MMMVGIGACQDSGYAPESSGSNPHPEVASPGLIADTPADLPGLPNVVAYAEGLYSGGAPEGDEGFDTLTAIGVRTVISVDGAQPEVDKARKHGLRYVHLPIGYNGMGHERTLEIARAVRDLPGPTYIHCHHGKHRSAGATGAAAVTLGFLTNDQAARRMKVSGTSPSYPGLFRCVAVASVASNQELLAANDAFPEHWHTTGLVQSMVEIDEIVDHLKAIRAAGWQTPAQHPDLVPAAEAGQLSDLFRNLIHDKQCVAKPGEFRDWLLAASHEAETLENELIKDEPSSQKLDGAWGRLQTSCTDCHAKYRD